MTKKSAQAKTLRAATGDYASLLSDIKQRIRAAQIQTAMASNASMLLLYWEIGGMLAERQKTEGWGAAVLPRLADDLRNELPEVKGFSPRNLRLMIQFFDEYRAFSAIWQPPVAKLEIDLPSAPKGPRPVAQLTAESGDAAVWQRAVANLTWAHNVILIQKVKHLPTRLWYALQAFEHGWSRDILSLQIQSRAHDRQGKAVTNFQRTLLPPQSDLAVQLLKDPYVFDFLTLENPSTNANSKPDSCATCRISSSNSAAASPSWAGRFKWTSVTMIPTSTSFSTTSSFAASSSSI